MRCFWDDANGAPFDASLYKVKVGKYFQEFDDRNETNEVQTISIKNITKSETWKGSANGFLGDIAILLLDDYIVFKTHISPVCIDYDLKYKNDDDMDPNAPIRIVGWASDRSADLSPSWLYFSKAMELSQNDKFCLR